MIVSTSSLFSVYVGDLIAKLRYSGYGSLFDSCIFMLTTLLFYHSCYGLQKLDIGLGIT